MLTPKLTSPSKSSQAGFQFTGALESSALGKILLEKSSFCTSFQFRDFARKIIFVHSATSSRKIKAKYGREVY